MTTDRLDIRPFENAVARLEEDISEYQADPVRTLLRDGVIQRFEFTCELAHKTLKRFLEFVSPNPAQSDQMSFQDLIRSGNGLGLLLGDWPTWRRYREMRSKTSHTWSWPGFPPFWKKPAICATH